MTDATATTNNKQKFWRAVVVVAFALIVFATISAYNKVKDPLAVGTGMLTKTLCSGVFVSGMSAEKIFQDEISGQSDLLARIPYEIDRENKRVDAYVVGIGGSAIFNPDTGCTVYRERNPNVNLVPRVARAQPKPLPTQIDDKYQKFLEPALHTPGTRAIMLWKDGRVVAESYADGISADTRLKGWSMNKTIVALLIGLMSDRGWIDVNAPAPIAQWQSSDDPRSQITVNHLLQMSSGLDFAEDYSALDSDVVLSLFADESSSDRAISSELAYEPGTHFAYSSGTTNILTKIAIDILEERGIDWVEFIHNELFKPLDITSVVTETDSNGYYIGSSYGYMTTADWARLGILFARGGKTKDGRQLLSTEWMQYMSQPTKESNGDYSVQLWSHGHTAGLPDDTFSLSGFRGQFVVFSDKTDTVLVRLGETPGAEFSLVASPLFAFGSN